MGDIAKNYERCRHFRGIQNECAEGIDPRDVRDSSMPGPYRWPCLSLIGSPPCATTCAKRVLMTADDLAAEQAEIEAVIANADLQISFGRCPTCSAPIEPTKTVGKCRYAACGHRLGQVLEAVARVRIGGGGGC